MFSSWLPSKAEGDDRALSILITRVPCNADFQLLFWKMTSQIFYPDEYLASNLKWYPVNPLLDINIAICLFIFIYISSIRYDSWFLVFRKIHKSLRYSPKLRLPLKPLQIATVSNMNIIRHLENKSRFLPDWSDIWRNNPTQILLYTSFKLKFFIAWSLALFKHSGVG